MLMQEIMKLDQEYNWHPCVSLKENQILKPLIIKKAYGSYFELASGQKVIDAIASWWCKTLGHNEPSLKAALLQQLDKFEHVIYANTTNETIAKLSKLLIDHTLQPMSKVLYASDGASAVEIALKMSLHVRFLQNNKIKKQFISLTNSYHGETLGTLSVSDIDIYRNAYSSTLFSSPKIMPPYVNSIEDPLWSDASDAWLAVEKYLLTIKEQVTAVIVEPIFQAAGEMRLYSKDFLVRLNRFCQKHDIHFIADEIMTGIARTGKFLAMDHVEVAADFICLGKGLTSGWLPLSAVMTTDKIYQYFYQDNEINHSFLHSHTYSGNALAASVAVATLEFIKQNKINEKAQQLQCLMRECFNRIKSNTGLIENIRGIGGVIAADLVNSQNHPRLGFNVFQRAIQLGAFLRPINNTIYWCPPLNISIETLQELADITEKALLDN